MNQNNLKETRSEKYKDPKDICDIINEKTEFLFIEYLNPNKISDNMHIKDIYQKNSNATLINTFDFPPNSITNLKNFPNHLPNLKVFVIRSKDFKSIQGFPKDLPNLRIFNFNESQISDLTPLPKNLPSLEQFFIRNNEIISLKGLPKSLPDVYRFFFDSIPIKSLEYLPESLPSVEKIEISGTNITNLQFFPETIPNLKELILSHNDLTTLRGLPLDIPKLNNIDIRNNYLSNLNHLPSHSKFGCTIKFQDNPIRTLYGINDVYIKKILYQIKFDEFSKKRLIEVNKTRDFIPKPKKASTKKITLSPSGIKFIENYRNPKDSPEILQKLLGYYKKSPHELAQQYASNPDSLNEGEIERLIWEANFDDRKLLENVVSAKDSVLKEISKRLKIPLNSKFSLLK